MASGWNNGNLIIDPGAVADAFASIRQDGTVRATMGYQNSASAYKLSMGDFGTNDTIIADTTGGKYKGHNIAPAAGFIGEILSTTFVTVALTNTIPANLATLNLTSGVWDVSLSAFMFCNGNSTALYAGISATSATLSGVAGINYAWAANPSTAGISRTMVVPRVRVVVTSTTAYYAVGRADFSTGSSSNNGIISATRVG